MFGKPRKEQQNDQVIMRMVTDGEVREITVKELLLSQNLSLEAITSLLIKKGIFSAEELLDELQRLQAIHAGKADPDTNQESVSK